MCFGFERGEAAVNRVRKACPSAKSNRQPGHACIDTTTIYTKPAAHERLAVHADVEWYGAPRPDAAEGRRMPQAG